MAKRVFFSFHYQDVIDFRANVVRQHWVMKDREEAGYFDASMWESAKKRGSLKQLIDGALENTTATCVLIGSQTYARPWVRYEIVKSIARGNRTFGVHINEIKGKDQNTKPQGRNPFDYLAYSYGHGGASLSILEYNNASWVNYSDLSTYNLGTPQPEKANKAFKLSDLGYRTYSWYADDGYNNFSNWVGS